MKQCHQSTGSVPPITARYSLDGLLMEDALVDTRGDSQSVPPEAPDHDRHVVLAMELAWQTPDSAFDLLTMHVARDRL